ncbi:hypothetical protein [Escherichia coli]|uniref:hypothetical protein n=1 Tax=Escherichia coli TaxID=562 RepID=UPI0025A3CA7B|nr:hypothetical protein [Escherichia coli]
MKGKSALTLLLAGIFSCGTCQATGAEVTSESVFNILNSTGAATDKSYLSLNPDKYPNYRLLIHSAKLQNEIKSHYTKDEIQGLLTLTENTRKLTLTEKPWGTFILASTFEDDKTAAINAEDWQKGDRLKSVALLIAYLDKANFYVMEDS